MTVAASWKNAQRYTCIPVAFHQIYRNVLRRWQFAYICDENIPLFRCAGVATQAHAIHCGQVVVPAAAVPDHSVRDVDAPQPPLGMKKPACSELTFKRIPHLSSIVKFFLEFTIMINKSKKARQN
jgi:hypothetical protein